MRRHLTICATLLLLLGACTATPLPTPPSASADAHRMELVDRQAGQVALTGSAGAVSPGGALLRVTGPGSAIERPVADDGSFAAALSGQRSDTYYLEVIEASVETFVLAITGGPGASVDPADEGPDRDGDGSPDVIDSAPDDSGIVGRGCAAEGDPASCTPLPETCNGLDDDGDGLIDDEACACTGDEGCSDGQQCLADTCTTACLSDDDCLGEQLCDRGFCR